MEKEKQFLVQLTLKDLIEVLDRRYTKNSDDHIELVTGMSGLAKLFGCSKATAQRIKSSGVIDAAISQIGRTFVVDTRKALTLVQNSDTVWAKKYSKKN